VRGDAVAARRRASLYLYGVGVLFLVVFALPLFIDPYWWADRFGWDTSPHTDVGTYFGRCLGAVGLAISGLALWGAREPEQGRALFYVTGIGAVLLAIVHLRGAVEDSQPLVEHLETLMYAGFAAVAFWCLPPRESEAQARGVSASS
jgi:hypothetical protein